MTKQTSRAKIQQMALQRIYELHARQLDWRNLCRQCKQKFPCATRALAQMGGFIDEEIWPAGDRQLECRIDGRPGPGEAR